MSGLKKNKYLLIRFDLVKGHAKFLSKEREWIKFNQFCAVNYLCSSAFSKTDIVALPHNSNNAKYE